MAKTVVELKCFCGAMIALTQKDIDTSEEQECRCCGYEMYCPPTIDEIMKQNSEIESPDYSATHVRVMARGEDGMEFCIQNSIAKDNPLLEIAVVGYQQQYPEAHVWLEDEESTAPLQICEEW